MVQKILLPWASTTMGLTRFPASSSLSTFSTTDMSITKLSKGVSHSLSSGIVSRFSRVNTLEK